MKLNGAINGCEPLDEAFLAVVYDEIEGKCLMTACTSEQFYIFAN